MKKLIYVAVFSLGCYLPSFGQVIRPDRISFDAAEIYAHTGYTFTDSSTVVYPHGGSCPVHFINQTSEKYPVWYFWFETVPGHNVLGKVWKKKPDAAWEVSILFH